jgi:DNA-binding response OmpR family regulator
MTPAPKAQNQRVLLLDAYQALTTFLVDLLASEGYGVDVVDRCTVEALQQALTRVRPDWVIVGEEVCQFDDAQWTVAAWVRLHLPTLPFVLFSRDPGMVGEALA